MRNYLLLTIVIFCGLGVQGQTLKELTNNLVATKEMKHGRFAFNAIKVKSGEIVIAKNVEDKLIPASTQKLLTAYSALDLLGKENRFTTKLAITGTIDANGTLSGDVIIIGGGDPVLASDNFKAHYESKSSVMSQFTEAIKAAGIKEIKGRIIGDGSIYDGEVHPKDWVAEDIGNYYGAGAFGLSYKENYYNIFLNSTSTVDDIVTIDESTSLMPYLDYQIKAKGAKINSDQVYVYSPPFSDYAILRGEMPLSKSKFKVKAAMTDPAYEMAVLLQAELSKNSISVQGDASTARMISLTKANSISQKSLKVLMEIKSPELLEIVNYMNIKSNNLVAEHLVKQISLIKGDGSGSTVDGIERIEKWLQNKGIGNAGMRIKDGSGLSHTNLVNAKWFVTFLVKMASEPWFEEVKNGLPLSGKTGSMRRVGKGTALENNMRAKTGYIDGVRAYSGYLINAKGELIAFSILANDYNYSASGMRKEMEKLLIKLY